MSDLEKAGPTIQTSRCSNSELPNTTKIAFSKKRNKLLLPNTKSIEEEEEITTAA